MTLRLHLALERARMLERITLAPKSPFVLEKAHMLDPKREAWFHAQRLEQISTVTVKRAGYRNVCRCTRYPWLHHRGVGQCAWGVLKRA